MAKKRLKVVVDTNWWVSFAMNPLKSQLASLLLDDTIDFIGSLELQEELFSVIDRPELSRFFKGNAINELHEIFSKAVSVKSVSSEVTVCRDPKDNFLLALCKDAHADFLITGDKDLLALQQFEQTTILSMSDFLLI
jgi:putative PIN family toxin of toxin-antitoxin system